MFRGRVRRLSVRARLIGSRNMTRRLLILAAFLLAGAVVNVGVAWGCAEITRQRDAVSASDAGAR